MMTTQIWQIKSAIQTIKGQMRADVPDKKMSTVQTDYGKRRPTNFDGFDPKRLEIALQKVRAEAEEERRLDSELDAIPETAFDDVERFWKTVNQSDGGTFGHTVRFPDMMPLDNGEIGLEWREGQTIFTLSFGGDGHIVFAGIFSAESKARGILTFSTHHLIAITGMIASVYPCDGD